MVNMAVISLKDMIKYLVKITIVISIVIEITRYFSVAKDEIQKQAEHIQSSTLLSCLDTAIPTISAINREQKEEQTHNPVLLALDTQLGMIASLQTEDNTIHLASQEEIIGQAITEKTQKEDQQNAENVTQATTGLKTEVQKTNVPERYSSQYHGVKIRNETQYKLTQEILTPDIKVNKNNILIFHTHTCESYTASGGYEYKQTGNFRTTDKNYSVVRVGRELDKQLTSYGYHVIHNETYHDYPSYTGSYSNSLKTVTKLLAENKNTDIVIDLHRDAIGDTTYAPTVKIGDEYAAQLMFVIGGNGSTIKHETWAQNLKFAVKIQEKANELYPGLFKPIILRYSGYNQHVSKAATIIEVGSTGNTLDQCLNSMKYLAKVMDEALK